MEGRKEKRRGIRKTRKGEAKNRNWNRIRRVSGKQKVHVRKCSQTAVIFFYATAPDTEFDRN
jgi:hypothetical protein